MINIVNKKSHKLSPVTSTLSRRSIMREIIGNFWEVYREYDIICVTTNEVIKKNNELVMGAGMAKQFASRYPELPRTLGSAVKKNGNVPICVDTIIPNPMIISFPTKYHWRDKSDLKLILESAKEIKAITAGYTVLSTRPGCGLGGLSWEKDVKPVLSKIWDSDRFTIISPR